MCRSVFVCVCVCVSVFELIFDFFVCTFFICQLILFDFVSLWCLHVKRIKLTWCKLKNTRTYVHMYLHTYVLFYFYFLYYITCMYILATLLIYFFLYS